MKLFVYGVFCALNVYLMMLTWTSAPFADLIKIPLAAFWLNGALTCALKALNGE